jgi:DNA-binding transcriptional MerR regulator
VRPDGQGVAPLRPARPSHPAAVSDDGYRWYGEDQVGTARVIARLRSLEVPLDVVRAVLAGTGDAELRRLLAAHRAVLQAGDDRIRRALHSLDHLLSDSRGATMALGEAAAPAVTDERKLAALRGTPHCGERSRAAAAGLARHPRLAARPAALAPGPRPHATGPPPLRRVAHACPEPQAARSSATAGISEREPYTPFRAPMPSSVEQAR